MLWRVILAIDHTNECGHTDKWLNTIFQARSLISKPKWQMKIELLVVGFTVIQCQC